MLFLQAIHWSDKAIAEFRHGFDKLGNFRGISENFAQTFHDGVEAGIEIHKSVGRPNRQTKFFAGNQFAWTVEKFKQHGKELLLKFDAYTTLTKFVCAGVKFKYSETVH